MPCTDTELGRRREPIRAAHTSPPTTLSRNRGQGRVRQTYTDVPRTSEAPASPYATPPGQYPRCEHTGRSRFEPQNGVNALLPTTMPSRRTRTRSRWSRVGKWSGMANPLIAGDLGAMRALRKQLRAEESPQIAHTQHGEGKWTWSAEKVSNTPRSGICPCSYPVRGRDTESRRWRVDMGVSAAPNLRTR